MDDWMGVDFLHCIEICLFFLSFLGVWLCVVLAFGFPRSWLMELSIHRLKMPSMSFVSL